MIFTYASKNKIEYLSLFYNMSITPAVKATNRIEFDRVTTLLMGIGGVVSKIKSEMVTMRSKYASMVEIISNYSDQISAVEKELYDVQVQAFYHTVYMYLGLTDSNGKLYINPVTPTSTSTPITITITYPNYTMTKTLFSIDNMVSDIINLDLYIGTITINSLKSSELETQFSSIIYEPVAEPYFSREAFISGVAYEIDNLLLINDEVCRMDNLITSGMRYIADLKSIGLYN